MAAQTQHAVLNQCLCIILAAACNPGAGESGSETETSGSSANTTTQSGTETTSDGTSAGPTTSDSETATGSGTSETTSDTGEPVCPGGTVICMGNEALVCDGNGGYSGQEECSDYCLDGVGCVACEPGTARCQEDSAEVCAEDGSAYELVEHCDPIQGLTCEAGSCQGVCAAQSLGASHVGCSFFPTQTAGLRSDTWPFTFGVAVVNTSDETANLRVENGDAFIFEFALEPGAVTEVDLPDIPDLVNGSAAADPSKLVPGGAYRLRSDQPVAVYQYNPNGTSMQGVNTFVNDSTVLFPAHTLGHRYRVVSRNHWVSEPNHRSGFYAVTATRDNTEVVLTPSASGSAVLAGGGVAADGTGVVMLDTGDVLVVYTDSLGEWPDASDLTGTLVSADRPIQVIGGHKCTYIPHNVAACERLEEALPPVVAAGTEHVVVAPLVSTGGDIPKVQMVRITATEDATNLEFSPDIDDAPTLLANAGDYVELGPLNDDFVVTSDAPVLVSQYMVGQNGGNNTGDPAMLVTTPTAQYHDSYLLHASKDFTFNYISVVAPTGSTVELDGVTLAPFVEIGESGFAVARTPLPPNSDGLYSLTGDAEFTVNVYGYTQHSTYWHGGGQRLGDLGLSEQ